MIPLDESRLERAFGRAVLDRAEEYVRKGRVLEAFVETSGNVRGIVKGSEWKPYEQKITFDGDDIDGLCTCPVGENCKHVAAVLLDIMGQDEVVEAAPVRSDPQVATWLKTISDIFADPNAYPPDVPQRVFYILQKDEKGFITVEIVSTRLLKVGGYGKPVRLSLNHVYSHQWPRHVLPIDVRLVETLVRSLTRSGYESKYRIAGVEGARIMRELMSTQRCVWADVNTPPLVLGANRRADLKWEQRADGSQVPFLDAQGIEPIPTTPAWYFDPVSHEAGELELDLPSSIVGALVQAPPIKPESVEAVRRTIGELLPDRPDLLPKSRSVEIRQVKPTPVLQISLKPCIPTAYSSSRRPILYGEIKLPVARLTFDYDGVRVRQGAPGTEVRKTEGDAVVILPRRPRLEGRAATPVLEGGWTPGRSAYNWKLPSGYGEDYLILPESESRPESYRNALYRFLRSDVPVLEAQGWRVEVENGLEMVEPIEWHLEAREAGADWFDLDLGVMVGEERVPLLPILIGALGTLRGRRLDDVPDDFELFHPLSNGKILVLPAERLKPLLKTLSELFGKVDDWPDRLTLSGARAGELAGLDDPNLEWQLPDRLKELRDRLASFDQIVPVAAPDTLKGDLRPYQLQGLSWLQFLREFGFNGILADDMGLGKTIQTLAHILIEQKEGRLDRPVLIVAPTSTLPNWRAEAEKFAPSLRTLVLRGPDRKALYDEIPNHDLAITSYPLLARDREELKKWDFHLVVLDEAQNIKNHLAAAAQAARDLKARHRVCLSGTPVENRLEELWSLFHFLMPGFLGTITKFRKEFRTPIESQTDPDANGRLARRIRPFILRRTKDLVAKELPEKTTLVERVELVGGQRDLYESLRLAMDKRVRELVAAKGFERSHIEILEALLKLRQACCDPRLVKLASAKKVTESAKLERLMELMTELRAEGRRILIFSQFTTMLDLIEAELKKAEIEWVRISGDTEDRETPVKRFQAREVSVFLISLRAGGTGLNLTAADTVIHYDPWWNPAVEAQATDRAHRIGQTETVLVIKLVAEGTVEEKILELQDRKARLAESILGGSEVQSPLTAEELRWVFEEK